MLHRTKSLFLVLIALVTAATIIGCDKKITITRVPTFYTQELTSIAVAPFRNQTAYGGAGDIMADKVAAGLMSNGTYHVVNRNNLKAVLDEKDLQMALSNDPGAAAQLQKLSNVQAILTGTVATYAATSNRTPISKPVYRYDKHGNQYYAGQEQYVQTRNEATVSVTATLIRVSDGQPIYVTGEPLWQQNWAEGHPPKKDPHALLNDAANAVAKGVVMTFAPTRMTIKVDEKKALFTAREEYDGEWDKEDKFTAADDKAFIVVSLPKSCDRNPFRITIIPKEQRTVLFEEELVWDQQETSVDLPFSPKDIYNRAGAGKYEVKFYSGAKPVLKRDIKIEPCG
ncbi:MAG: hypothetical protein GVY16_08560 [Planctomycetes bacterium]|jgi:hypothetical protein|nr:hypothetical protein [Phycisphaerae bacterium]NBB95778.1 hypothetical protein [Planctomycetota bacterium]